MCTVDITIRFALSKQCYAETCVKRSFSSSSTLFRPTFDLLFSGVNKLATRTWECIQKHSLTSRYAWSLA